MAIKRTPLYKSGISLVEDGLNRWVEYTRYPGMRYEYLEIGETERRILNGETIRKAFVTGLTTEGFSRVMADTGMGERDSIRIEGESLTVCVPIVIKESIIHVTALQGLILDPTHGDMALDASFNPKTDAAPNHFLSAVNCTGTQFQGSVSVTGAEFSNLIFFEGTGFHDVADFTGAVFFDTAVFKGARFIKDTTFDRATFHGTAQFVAVEFQGRASFEDAVFFENAFFTETRFFDEARMVGSHFAQMLYAPASVFGKDALFDRSCFCLVVEMKDAVFKGVLSVGNAVGNVLSLDGAQASGPVRIVDTPFSVLDFTGARCERDVTLFGSRWEESMDDICNVVSRGMDIQEGGTSDEREGDERERWVKRRIEETETVAAMHRERGRIVDMVGLEDIRVDGCFRCDFSHLEPSSREFPVLDSHRRALKNRDPEGSEGNRAAWRRAEGEYAWLVDQYDRQGMVDDEESARLWQSECRIRGLSGWKMRLFRIHQQNVKWRRDRKKKKESSNTEKNRKGGVSPGSKND
ncbi:MAG: pentapeptide repeat-containing protein [Deltaproteobacteria bacterium]|nr:pentapeptide repeat-containing protein [Candidatus Zymogenaceae bacterium]